MTGEMVASTPTLCEGAAAVKTHIDGLTLGAITDRIEIIPCPGRTNCWLVFKIDITA